VAKKRRGDGDRVRAQRSDDAPRKRQGDGERSRKEQQSRVPRQGDGDGGDGGTTQTKQVFRSPAGDIITNELLPSGDVRVEGSKRAIQDFLSNVDWRSGYDLQLEENGVTLLLKHGKREET
jgi:hypothetical protein